MSKSSVCKLQYVEEREILQSKILFCWFEVAFKTLSFTCKNTCTPCSHKTYLYGGKKKTKLLILICFILINIFSQNNGRSYNVVLMYIHMTYIIVYSGPSTSLGKVLHTSPNFLITNVLKDIDL